MDKTFTLENTKHFDKTTKGPSQATIDNILAFAMATENVSVNKMNFEFTKN